MGAIAFYGFLAGSFGIIGIVIKKLGFDSDLKNWDIGLRKMTGVIVGFFVAIGFYAGILYLGTWFAPSAFLLFLLGVFLVLKRPGS